MILNRRIKKCAAVCMHPRGVDVMNQQSIHFSTNSIEQEGDEWSKIIFLQIYGALNYQP